MKKTSRPVITGIVTTVILLAALVSCSNLNIRKQASIVISFGNARSGISYQKSDAAYYMISLQPEVQQPKRVEASQSTAEITGIDEGTYTLLVKAYNANDELIAEGRTEGIQVVIGETATATVQMEAKTYHGHEWNNGEETPPATCTEAGILTYTCTDCHATKTEVIPAKHVWGNYVYDEESATEEHVGTKTAHCENCEATDELPANGPYTATYQFTETIQPAPEGYSGSMGETGRYVMFGDFPQTFAFVDPDINPHPEENGYYVGSDGDYYEKVVVKEYSGNGRLMSDETTTIKTGDTVYFKVEPIIWRVLSEEYDWDGEGNEEPAAFLLAENILTANVPWWEWTSSGSTYHHNMSDYSDPIYADNYMHSQIRAYLNGIEYDAADEENNTRWVKKGFLQTAFTDKANKLIYTTVVDNNIPDDPPLTCENTEDKIFLISNYELSGEKYGFSEDSDSIRLRKATDYAYANNLKYNVSIEKSPWRLRTPFRRGNDSVLDRKYFKIVVNGTISSFGGAEDLYYGIVPALTVPVSALPAQ